MPFGLCNAPATFCRLMEQVLADIVWSKCLVYLDDIVAYGSTFRVAYENLEAVFKRLQATNLKLKPKKCELFRDKLDYLGHEVSREGIRPSHAKIAGLHDWAPPETISELRTFLGFTSYYRCFVDGYSKLAVPLTHLLKKEAAWSGRQALPEDAREAFEAIKATLIKDCLLKYILPHTDFLLDVDASQTAIGACLQQYQAGELVMLAYCSKTLSTSRQNYCTTKREMYACIYAMRYFQGFIKGQMTVIRTDHAALVWLLGFKGSDSMYHCWIAEMSSYEPYRIISHSGDQHRNADGMSRARKHCKFEQCESCAYHSKRND